MTQFPLGVFVRIAGRVVHIAGRCSYCRVVHITGGGVVLYCREFGGLHGLTRHDTICIAGRVCSYCRACWSYCRALLVLPGVLFILPVVGLCCIAGRLGDCTA